MKKKLLVVLPTLPYPLTAGGNQAMYNGVAAIKDFYDVTVVYLEYYNKPANARRDALAKLWENVKIVPFVYNHRKGLYKLFYWFVDRFAEWFKLEKRCPDYTSDLMMKNFKPVYSEYADFLNDLILSQKFDLVQLEMIPCLPHVLSLPPFVKKVFVHHELRYVVNGLKLKFLGASLYRQANLSSAKIMEIGMLNKCDAVITLSETDKKKLIEEGVSVPIYASFATVNTSLECCVKNGFSKMLSFVGPAHHEPNFIGLSWFLKECWGKLLSKDGAYHLNVIGQWPELLKNEICSKYKNVHFLGFVENLNEALKGTVMIVPITVGSGIRMKILEAVSLGVPFVSTSVGAEGLPFENGRDCYKADSPDDFITAIMNYENESIRVKFSSSAKRIVEESFSNKALRMNRVRIYKNILDS